MKHILIAAHGRMANGIKSSMDILLGSSTNVTALDAYIDQTNIETVIQQFIENVPPQDQALLLSDLYGGSVNQIMYRYSDHPNVILVTGINLALVLELCATPDHLTVDDVDDAIKLCQKAMRRMEYDHGKDDEPKLEESFF